MNLEPADEKYESDRRPHRYIVKLQRIRARRIRDNILSWRAFGAYAALVKWPDRENCFDPWISAGDDRWWTSFPDTSRSTCFAQTLWRFAVCMIRNAASGKLPIGTSSISIQRSNDWHVRNSWRISRGLLSSSYRLFATRHVMYCRRMCHTVADAVKVVTVGTQGEVVERRVNFCLCKGSSSDFQVTSEAF